jgi:hypothetical protein
MQEVGIEKKPRFVPARSCLVLNFSSIHKEDYIYFVLNPLERSYPKQLQ